jgi:hypothetical protein
MRAAPQGNACQGDGVSGAGLVGPPHGPGGHTTGTQHVGNASDSVAGRAARACRWRDGVAVTQYNLHSARRNKASQAASVGVSPTRS